MISVMVRKVISNDRHKVPTVGAATFFLEILEPTHFISKISFFLDFKKKGSGAH